MTERILLQKSFEDNGGYPVYTLGTSYSSINNDSCFTFTIARQYDEHDIIVNVYDDLNHAFSVFKSLTGIDDLTMPSLDEPEYDPD